VWKRVSLRIFFSRNEKIVILQIGAIVSQVQTAQVVAGGIGTLSPLKRALRRRATSSVHRKGLFEEAAPSTMLRDVRVILLAADWHSHGPDFVLD
jgi:hypothetical protein